MFECSWSRRKLVTIPSVPIVAMKAKASGMPPKFAATPEKVVRAERIQRGVPSRIAAYAIDQAESRRRAAP